MLEHLAGRPSALWKRNQILLVIVFWLWRIIKGDPQGPRIFRIPRINRFLSKFTPWQIIVTTLSAAYALRNVDTLLGLGAPEPLANLYSPDFYRSTWLTTALDAGFATAMTIQPKFLRNTLSMVFFLYYLVYAREADEKLRRFRAICTVEMLRTTWNKTTNPYIRALTYFSRPRISIVRRLFLSRPRGSSYTKPVACTLFYAGSLRDLASDSHGVSASELVYDIPGGGFVAMGPEHHEERLRNWAIRTGRPVLSLNYGKAPEYPFPWALNEAFDVYRVLAESNGRAIGMSGRRPIKIILSGDSAGANVAVALMCKIIESTTTPLALTRNGTLIPPLPYPYALVMAYPALDFNFTSWMSPDHLDVLRSEQRAIAVAAAAQSNAGDEPKGGRARADSSEARSAGATDGTGMGSFLSRNRTTSMTNVRAMKRLAEQKDHLGHKSPLAVVKDVRTTRLAVVNASSLATAVRKTKKKRSTSSSPSTVASDATTTASKTSGKKTSGRGRQGATVGVMDGEHVEPPEQEEGKETVVMGVRRKKSWSQSLSGTFKMLSPVISSSTSTSTSASPTVPSPAVNGKERKATQPFGTQVSNGPSPTPSLTRPSVILAGAAAGGQQQKLSKDSSFKTRLRESISELDRLEVNTTSLDLTPKAGSFVGATAGAGVVASDNIGFIVDPPEAAAGDLSTTDSYAPPRSISILAPPTTGGIEADDESSSSAETSESDGLSGVPEGEREYYPLAEKDKPLGARVLYSSDDEMGEFFHANADPHSVHPLHISPSAAAAGRLSSSSLLSPVTGTGAERGLLEVEHVRKGELAEDNKAMVKPSKKVPIGTRLTMTSRAGFFQDRIVSPSMMRAMTILYIGPKRNPDFAKDYYISPILAPAHLLVYFPPVLMVCGEKDPFVDDTVIFGGRLREAKRARRADMLAARQGGNAGESLRMSRPSTSNHGSAGLRGDDARRAREQALLYEDESDWVEMRILEGWGHGFLQMTSPLMLGQAAENVIHEMADWILDAFTPPKRGRASADANHAPLLPVTTTVGDPTPRRKSSPPRVSNPIVASSHPDTPPPRHPKRPSSVASSTRRAPSPPSSFSATPPANGRSGGPAIKSNLTASDLPLVSSGTETETERDIPLTFTVARKAHLNGNRTPRNSFGAAEGQGAAPLTPPRRSLLQHTTKQSGSLPNETVSVQQGSSLPSSPASSPSSSKNSNNDAHHLNDVNAPLSPATAAGTGTAPNTFAASFGFGNGSDFVPRQSASPKPGGGAAVLISETELMRRRREEAVFGMGESVAADDEGGITEYGGSPRSPSPAATRRGSHTRAWNSSISSVESIDKNANGV